MANREVIAIGGSLGAIEPIRELCRAFPADLAATVIVVMHVGSRSNNMLTSILDVDAALPVSSAVDRAPLRQSHIYVAPADHHMVVIDGMIRLGHGPRE